MRLSRKFVSEYTNLDNIDIHEYADKLLKLGNEYESITKLVNATKLIVGEVVKNKINILRFRKTELFYLCQKHLMNYY